MGMYETDNVGENGFISNNKGLATKAELAQLQSYVNELKVDFDKVVAQKSDSVWIYDESMNGIRPKNMDELNG